MFTVNFPSPQICSKLGPPPRAPTQKPFQTFIDFSQSRKAPGITWLGNVQGNSATQCFVETNNTLIEPIPEYFNDNISPCHSNACLTCNSFISDQSFKSNLTGRIYKTQTYEQLTCESSNVVCAMHCIGCGLMYVGETGRSLWSRINGHRAGIIKDGQSLLCKHFRLPGHSVADMKVQILEKIYHSSENPVNIGLHRRIRELHWIKELSTGAPMTK